jgi:hypothetical protein
MSRQFTPVVWAALALLSAMTAPVAGEAGGIRFERLDRFDRAELRFVHYPLAEPNLTVRRWADRSESRYRSMASTAPTCPASR